MHLTLDDLHRLHQGNGALAFHFIVCNFDCMSFRWNSKWNTVQLNYIWKIAALFYTMRFVYKHIRSTKMVFYSLFLPFTEYLLVGLDFDETAYQPVQVIWKIFQLHCIRHCGFHYCGHACLRLCAAWWKPVKIPPHTFLIVLTFYFIRCSNAYVSIGLCLLHAILQYGNSLQLFSIIATTFQWKCLSKQSCIFGNNWNWNVRLMIYV